jgi:hypothetical protein
MFKIAQKIKNNIRRFFVVEGPKENKPTHLESFIGHIGNKLLRHQRDQFCDLYNDFIAVIYDSQRNV